MRAHARKLFFISLVFNAVFSIASLNSLAQSAIEADSQFWNDTNIVIPVVRRDKEGKKSDLVNLLLLTTNRLGGDGFYPVDDRIGAGLEFLVNKYLTVTPSYLFRGARINRTVWNYEHRFRIEATIGNSWKNVSIKNRNRLEHGVQLHRRDFNRYRNRTTVRFPIRKNEKVLFDVFTGIEPFYLITLRHWSNYEVSAGISSKINGRVSADFYYLHRGPFHVPSQPINAAAFNLRIKLGR